MSLFAQKYHDLDSFARSWTLFCMQRCYKSKMQQPAANNLDMEVDIQPINHDSAGSSRQPHVVSKSLNLTFEGDCVNQTMDLDVGMSYLTCDYQVELVLDLVHLRIKVEREVCVTCSSLTVDGYSQKWWSLCQTQVERDGLGAC